MQALELKIPPVVQAAIAAALMWALARLLPGLAFRLPAALPVALVLTLAGAVIAVLGVWEFRCAGTTVDPRVPHRSACLVDSGIYRFTRNPMYLGMLLVLTAGAVYLGNLAAFAVLPVFVVCMNRLQICPEERFMQEKFGEAYRDYTARVRRWI